MEAVTRQIAIGVGVASLSLGAFFFAWFAYDVELTYRQFPELGEEMVIRRLGNTAPVGTRA